MLKNISYMEINRNKVMLSAFFIPLAAPILLLLLGLNTGVFDLTSVLGGIILSLIYGAFFYIPAILGALLIEFILIREQSTEKQVLWALIIEGVLAFLLIFFLVFDFGRFSEVWVTISLFLSILLPQCFRWWYLKGKDRMFMSSIIKDNQEIIDQNSGL